MSTVKNIKTGKELPLAIKIPVVLSLFIILSIPFTSSTFDDKISIGLPLMLIVWFFLILFIFLENTIIANNYKNKHFEAKD